MLRLSQYRSRIPNIIPILELPWDTRLDEKRFCERVKISGRMDTGTIGEISDVQRFKDPVPAYCFQTVCGITTENITSYRHRPTQAVLAQRQFEQDQELRRQAKQEQADREWKAAAPSLVRHLDPVLKLLDAMPHAKEWASVTTRNEWSRFGQDDAKRRQVDDIEWLWRRSRMLTGHSGTKERSLIDLAAWKATFDARA